MSGRTADTRRRANAHLPALVLLSVITAFSLPADPTAARSSSSDSGPAGHNCVMPPLPLAWHKDVPELVPLGYERMPTPRLPSPRPELAPRRRAVQTSGVIPILLVDFTDVPAVTSPADIDNRFFGGGPARSVRSYYDEVSYGDYDLEGEVFGWFHSTETRGYYVFNESGFSTRAEARIDPYHRNIWGLIKETVELADPSVDFSLFDNDGPDGTPNSGDDDGMVDALVIVPTGPGAEEQYLFPERHFWSHKFDLRQCVAADYCPFGSTGLMTDDGVLIGPYMEVPELGEIGVVCHEYGHILGLPDIYYFDGPDDVSPLGIFGLMDVGAWMCDPDDSGAEPGDMPVHFCAWSKYTLGWIDPLAVSLDTDNPLERNVVLPPVARGSASDPGILRMLDNPGGADWDRTGQGEGRYFLLENRAKEGFDRGLFCDFGLSGDGGLLVTFIDESRPESGSNPLIYVIQADGEDLEFDGDLPHSGESSDFWPRTGADPDTFNAESVPGRGIFDAEVDEVSAEGIERLAADDIGFDARLSDFYFPPEDTTDDGAFPNPASVYAFIQLTPPSGAAADYRVRIFSLGGELVRVLDDPLPESRNQVLWDLSNEDREPVANGIYVYVAEAGGSRMRGTIVVRR